MRRIFIDRCPPIFTVESFFVNILLHRLGEKVLDAPPLLDTSPDLRAGYGKQGDFEGDYRIPQG